MNDKIFPRNLTARAAQKVAGNPANTRLESGVGNCYPGLEFDIRNLDRRFFPGLLFEFVSRPDHPVPEADPYPQGMKLLYLDYLQDPMLPETSHEAWVRRLLRQYRGPVGEALSVGKWFLDWVEQSGKRIVMFARSGEFEPLDGRVVWQLVRGLEPGIPITISLSRRDGDREAPKPSVQLSGYRRAFLDEAGVIDRAYRSGELTQSLCTPWAHDFRDCACHYWASNHPDVVIGQSLPEDRLPEGEPDEVERATTRLDWLRADRGPSGAVAARSTIAENRPYQFDHYQINQSWEQLAFVLENKEIGDVYEPEKRLEALEPFESSVQLIEALEEDLAPLELVLATLYLYAYFSLRDDEDVPSERWPTMRDDVTFVRQSLMVVAVSEMTHLSWANELIRELYQSGRGEPGRTYEPILRPLDRIPAGKNSFGGTNWKPAILRPLTFETLDDFIAVEHPETGFVDTAYARVVRTLREPEYPPHLYELAVRIDTDGVEHYRRFRDIRRVLAKNYGDADPPHPYLREIELGTPEDAEPALEIYRNVLKELHADYLSAPSSSSVKSPAGSRARKEMHRLRDVAEDLARKKGIGIPFGEIFGKEPRGR